MTEVQSSVTDEPPAEVQNEGVIADTADQQGSKEYNFRKLEESKDKEIGEERAKASLAQQQLAVIADRLDRLERSKEQVVDSRDPDDLVNYGEVSRKQQEYDQKIAVLEAKAEKMVKLEAKATYSDLDSVISSYGKQLSPAVAKACLQAENPYIAAYEACKNSQAYYRDTMANSQHDHAKRAEANAKKPGNPAQLGGKGALSAAKDYAKMSDAEILRMGDRARLG